MADCIECLGTGWACQPPRCEHPQHVSCPWCNGSGESRSGGVDLIAMERSRQVNAEGWTPEHDDEHGCFELTTAALCYADMAAGGDWLHDLAPEKWDGRSAPAYWPWHESWWKPSTDPIRNLVKAGALIAAEIDRLQRATHAASSSRPSVPEGDPKP